MRKEILEKQAKLRKIAEERQTAFKSITIEDRAVALVIDIKGTKETIAKHDELYDLDSDDEFHMEEFIEWLKEYDCQAYAQALNDNELSKLHAENINNYAIQIKCDLDPEAYIAWFLIQSDEKELLEQYTEDEISGALDQIAENIDIFL